MNPHFYPPGEPGAHEGISHTLKHYLNPLEMWEDLAAELPEAVRPRPTWEALPRVPLAEIPPHPEVAARWSALAEVYQNGYTPLVRAQLRPLTAPPSAPWVRIPGPGRRVWGAHVGEGVLVVLSKAGGFVLTAYRPQDFALKDYACPPRSPRVVLFRKELARLTADRRVAAWKGQENA